MPDRRSLQGRRRGGRATRPLTVLALLAACWGGEAQAEQGGLFGSLEFESTSLIAVPQWEEVIRRIDQEEQIYRACDGDVSTCPSPRVTAWRAKVETLQTLPPVRQLDEINRFVNNVMPYLTDSENYDGVTDYWAAPIEFLRRSGDCEDFAIIKFVSLLHLGFSNEQMRIVVVMDVLRNLPHAVLSVQIDGKNYILDSLLDVVIEDTHLSQYKPQYSVNRDRRWAHIFR